MIDAALARPRPIAERTSIDAEAFRETIVAAGMPIILRGQVAAWPGVGAARSGEQAIAEYLLRLRPTRPVNGVQADPAEGGRFGLTPGMDGFNFARLQGQLADFLAMLLRVSRLDAPPAMAAQSEPLADLLPGFALANPMPLLPGVGPRIWIGNRIRVMPHFDLKENLACCLAGRRRFLLFPSDQLPNLYPGPFELTPAGTPISMVDPAAPDLARYPRYAEAATHALEAKLEPGDALYIPFGWWHGVDSLDPVSILVNYWWDESPPGSGSGYDALLHCLHALRHQPPRQRAFWRGMLDHYVFEASGDPAAHLPPAARGVLGPASPELFQRMRAILRGIFAR